MIETRSPYSDLFSDIWIGWLGRGGHYCLGLTPTCPIRVVLCVDDSPVNDLIERLEGVRIFSLDRLSGRHQTATDAAADEILPHYRDQLLETMRQASCRRRVLASSIAAPSLAAFAAEQGAEFIGNSAELVDRVSDKRQLHGALAELGLPRILGRWTRLSGAPYAELASEMGSRFVAQIAHGASGSGTAFIASENQLASAAARFGDTLAWIAPDLGELSLNINAVALATGVAVSCPSVQLEGLAMVSAERGMYCGNDYIAAADLPRWIPEQAIEQTERIGRWLAARGYRGLFGLDFVIDRSTSVPHIVDLNPRWQGSTVLLTLAEHKAGRLPLAVAELAGRLELMSDAEILRHQDEFRRPVAASHISLRCPKTGWWKVGGALQPGVYDGTRTPAFVRHGLRLSDLDAPTEILVTGSVPREGMLLAPTSHVLRFSSERQVLDVSRRAPHAWSQAAVEGLYAALRLESVEEE